MTTDGRTDRETGGDSSLVSLTAMMIFTSIHPIVRSGTSLLGPAVLPNSRRFFWFDFPAIFLDHGVKGLELANFTLPSGGKAAVAAAALSLRAPPACRLLYERTGTLIPFEGSTAMAAQASCVGGFPVQEKPGRSRAMSLRV